VYVSYTTIFVHTHTRIRPHTHIYNVLNYYKKVLLLVFIIIINTPISLFVYAYILCVCMCLSLLCVHTHTRIRPHTYTHTHTHTHTHTYVHTYTHTHTHTHTHTQDNYALSTLSRIVFNRMKSNENFRWSILRDAVLTRNELLVKLILQPMPMVGYQQPLLRHPRKEISILHIAVKCTRKSPAVVKMLLGNVCVCVCLCVFACVCVCVCVSVCVRGFVLSVSAANCVCFIVC